MAKSGIVGRSRVICEGAPGNGCLYLSAEVIMVPT